MATDDVPGGGDPLGRRSGFSLWPAHRGNRVRTAVIGIVLAGYAWAAGATEPFSTIALVCVLIPGVVLAAIPVALPPQRNPPPEKVDNTRMFYWVIARPALVGGEASAWKDDSLPWH